MRIEEASYGRIYQHTRDNGTFAIIGSEDKDTHKSRYDELKSLIKEYEKKYGHLGYNRLSGTYQYQLTGEKVSEKSVIIYDIELKDALSIAKKINQESIIWKENTFFGIIDVRGSVIERFKKSALNFSKAIKNGIGSRLMSDQTREFGYAFEEVKPVRRNSISESILTYLKEDSDDWWENNYKRAIYYTQVENPETIVDMYYGGDWELYNCDTAKSVGLIILHCLGSKKFEKLLDDFGIPKEDEIKEDKNGFPIIERYWEES